MYKRVYTFVCVQEMSRVESLREELAAEGRRAQQVEGELQMRVEELQQGMQEQVGVVWCGVVWCGVVWCGVVWCGAVWCGVVWCGWVQQGLQGQVSVVWCESVGGWVQQGVQEQISVGRCGQVWV